VTTWGKHYTPPVGHGIHQNYLVLRRIETRRWDGY